MGITAGSHHTVALKSDGTVVVWGGSGYRETAVPAGLTGVTAISAGAFHTMAVGGLSPIITTQPVGATVNVVQGASFSVANTGTAPMSYQWRKNGGDVIGASSATLTLSNVQTNQAGNYAVVITNAFGSVTSSVVVLTVNRLVQTVSFGSLPAKRVDDAPFNLNATTSSGLPVSYSSSTLGDRKHRNGHGQWQHEYHSQPARRCDVSASGQCQPDADGEPTRADNHLWCVIPEAAWECAVHAERDGEQWSAGELQQFQSGRGCRKRGHSEYHWRRQHNHHSYSGGECDVSPCSQREPDTCNCGRHHYQPATRTKLHFGGGVEPL